ncbi:pilus assembly protein CpaE [Roseicyclus mahoneyensis]|uniref:Pilus assembly protein CpaE n=1 Tax=Roseicyclus mahoneyensis TaxID=164332 RepID=A0A316GFF5_9RHOB|nr:AAA family ATPase [Roseicyclus mahoneyensis]PWK59412.1 pilus assembly protein CpaE [Roseicyclus mahoneyensis]
MSSGLALRSDPAPILACTVSRNVHHFDLLIEDMEAELGEAWGDLTFDEARAFLDQPEAAELRFFAVAVTSEDAADLGQVGEVIRACKARAVRTVIVAHDLSPAALHELLRLGADDFVPYPLAEGALHDAIGRMRDAKPTTAAPFAAALAPATEPSDPAEAAKTAAPAKIAPRMGGQSAIFAVQGLAGGTGASTLAVNLAWELASIDKQKAPSVCLMDLDLQAGTVSTFLDLPRRDMVIELLQDAQSMDADAFKQALLGYEGKLSVFPAPPVLLPLDVIGPEEVEALLNLATQCFDIVIVDMPHTLVMWTETVLNRADVYFATMEMDMRSAQNAMRFLRALREEGLPAEKLNFVLNRAPGLTDLNGKSRVKKLAESLGVKISTQLPDGGKAVAQAGDHGEPLAVTAKKNALRREIAKLADGLHKAMLSDAAAAK